jgi:hypothetical protein
MWESVELPPRPDEPADAEVGRCRSTLFDPR